MDLKQLRALLAIAETGSVTRAADILHIVQPAISRQVKLLEEELGVALFDRERHGMVLTPAGRRFADRARRALDELDTGKAEISPRSQQVSGSVTVGFLPSLADLLVSTLMSRMRHTYPHVQVRSYITYLPDLEPSLEKAEVDVALVYLKPDAAARYATEALLEESLYLVGPPDSALDMDTPVPLAQINKVPLILPAQPHGVRTLVERECAAAGVDLNITAETNGMHLQKTLVMKGVGHSVLSGFVIADEVERGLLTASPIDSLNLKRKLHLARNAGKIPSPAASCVQEELRDIVRQAVLAGRWPGAKLM